MDDGWGRGAPHGLTPWPFHPSDPLSPAATRSRFHAKKRFCPTDRPTAQGSEDEEEGVLCICQRPSEQEGRSHRVGGRVVWVENFLSEEGATETRRGKSVGWCQPILLSPKSD